MNRNASMYVSVEEKDRVLSGLEMMPYIQWAKANKRKAPPDSLLLPLLEFYEANKNVLSMGDIARAGGLHISYTRVQSWIERARIRKSEPVTHFSPWKSAQEPRPVSAEWKALEKRAEFKRLRHIRQVKAIQQQRPEMSPRLISDELRRLGRWN